MRVASQRPLAEHVEGAAALTEPSHRVVDAAGPQPLLRQGKTLPDAVLATDDIVELDAHIVVEDLGVPARLAGAMVGLPIVGTSRRMSTPGVLVGTMIIE